MVTIRAAVAGDADVLSRLAVQTYVAAFGHSFEPANLVAHLNDNLSVACFEDILRRDIVLVAEQSGEIVGFLQFGAHHEAEVLTPACEIRRVYVLGRLQNNGVGRQLMEHALSCPDLRAARTIFLDVWEDNLAAQRFYARFDFMPVGKREFRVASGEVTGSDLILRRQQ